MHEKLNIIFSIVVILIFSCTVFADQKTSECCLNNSEKKNFLNLPFQIRSASDDSFTIRSLIREGIYWIKTSIESSSAVPLFVKNKNVMVRSNWVKIFLVIVSTGIIWFTVLYYLRRRKEKRFMTTTRLSVMSRMVQLAIRYIEKNYMVVGLSADKICVYLVTGRAYLEALFSKELGMKIEDFIDQARINRVKFILAKDPHSALIDIAAMTGFADEKNCADKFQRICGIDLETYREHLKINADID